MNNKIIALSHDIRKINVRKYILEEKCHTFTINNIIGNCINI
jgi:hypothetical protein